MRKLLLLTLKAVLLIVMALVLAPSPARNASFATSATARANAACDTESCTEKCRRLGYFGGWCQLGACVCFRIPPPPTQ